MNAYVTQAVSGKNLVPEDAIPVEQAPEVLHTTCIAIEPRNTSSERVGT